MEDLRLTSRIDEIAQRFADVPGGLMPALHAVQHELGYIDPAAVPVLAGVFNLSVAEVHGVVTFYADFRTTAPRGPIVQICRAEACQARGADAVMERARALSDSGAQVELAEVFCLGNCALGPSAATIGRLYGRLDPEAVSGLFDDAISARPATPVAAPQPTQVETVTVYVPIDAASAFGGSRCDGRRPRRAPGGSRRAQRVARHVVARADDRGGNP